MNSPEHAADGRHPDTQHLARLFGFDHLPDGPIRETSERCALLATDMIRNLPDGPELTAGLRKLLEAKDAFVRCAVLQVNGGRTGLVTGSG